MTLPTCPECGSHKAFWHCHDKCFASEHAVTCRDCKTPYTTKVRPAPEEDE